MHTASYEFLMKPKELPGCHQTLSTRVGSGDETSNIITTLTSYKQREGLSVTNLSLENKPPGLHTYLDYIHTCTAFIPVLLMGVVRLLGNRGLEWVRHLATMQCSRGMREGGGEWTLRSAAVSV